jgi:hypothetical protein
VVSKEKLAELPNEGLSFHRFQGESWHPCSIMLNSFIGKNEDYGYEEKSHDVRKLSCGNWRHI